jgi:hypothetical protein
VRAEGYEGQSWTCGSPLGKQDFEALMLQEKKKTPHPRTAGWGVVIAQGTLL